MDIAERHSRAGLSIGSSLACSNGARAPDIVLVASRGMNILESSRSLQSRVYIRKLNSNSSSLISRDIIL